MKLVFQKLDTLPRLAWCAKVEKFNESIRIFHGPYVEVSDVFFCDGVWSGDFASGNFETDFLMGSGGKITRNGLLISSPNHTMERIYVIQCRNTIFISNSCPFVLAVANEDIDLNYLEYRTKIASIISGLKKYSRSIPTRSGNSIRMFCHCNFYVRPDLELIEKPKLSVREFVNFVDYKSFIEEQIDAIINNANDSNRYVKYRPLATISSGYDSPASAFFAAKFGCDEAFTFSNASTDMDDSGAQIAKILGMKVKTFDRFDYLKQPDFTEAGWGGSVFLSFGNSLEKRLVFTGHNGDAVWDPFCNIVSPFIKRKGTSGNNLAELRLQVGFMHLPVPYIGCTSHPSIHRISTSEEMRPWSLNNKYNRPIPRRLLEEAGVKRNMFGIEKKAVEFARKADGGFEKIMDNESFTDFTHFIQKNYNFPLAMKLQFYRSAQYLQTINLTLNRIIERFVEKTIGKRVKLPTVMPHYFMRVQQDKYLFYFHWLMKKLISRYKVSSVDKSPKE